MLQDIFFLCAGFVFLLIETSWCGVLRFGLVQIDGLFPLVVWYSMRAPYLKGFFSIFSLGLLSFLFSFTSSYMIAFIISFLLIRFISSNICKITLFGKMVFTGLITLLAMIIVMSISNYPELIWPWAFLQACLNFLLAPLFFYFFDKFETA